MQAFRAGDRDVVDGDFRARDAVVRTQVPSCAAVADLRPPRMMVGGANLVVGFRPALWRAVTPQDAPTDVHSEERPRAGHRPHQARQHRARRRRHAGRLARLAHEVVEHGDELDIFRRNVPTARYASTARCSSASRPLSTACTKCSSRWPVPTASRTMPDPLRHAADGCVLFRAVGAGAARLHDAGRRVTV